MCGSAPLSTAMNYREGVDSRSLSSGVLVSIIVVCFGVPGDIVGGIARVSVLIALPATITYLILRDRLVAEVIPTIEGAVAAFLFLALIAGSLLNNDCWFGTGEDKILPMISLFGIVLAFFAGLVAGRDTRSRAYICSALLLVTFVNSAATIARAQTIVSQHYTRSNGLFGDPNIVVLMILPPALLGLALKAKRLRVILCIVVAVASGAAIITTVSRAGVLAFGAAIVFLILDLGRLRRGTGQSERSLSQEWWLWSGSS